jgi:hypothetical protein
MLMKKERKKERNKEKGRGISKILLGWAPETLAVQTLDAPPRLTSGDRLGK